MTTPWTVAAARGLALGCALAGTAYARDQAQDEHYIRTTEASVCDAFQAGDADVLRNALDDHFTLTDSKGVVANREQTVAAVARRDPTYLIFHNHDQSVRVYGDAEPFTYEVELFSDREALSWAIGAQWDGYRLRTDESRPAYDVLFFEMDQPARLRMVVELDDEADDEDDAEAAE